MASTDVFHIVSWNVNGLNLPEKRMAVLREWHRLNADICFIQETHFKSEQIPKFSDRFPLVYHLCVPDGKTEAASALVGRIHWILKEIWSGTDGRLLFVKGLIGSQPCTLASFYSPNSGQVMFIEKTLEKLQEFAEGVLELGG